jgi:hypothetical protein
LEIAAAVVLLAFRLVAIVVAAAEELLAFYLVAILVVEELVLVFLLPY